MGDFKRLLVWQKAHAMAIHAHEVSGRMRGSAHVSLRNQLVRAAMSVPTNIVEGRSQKSERDFGRFLGYAIGSLSEVEYHLIIGHDIKAINDADYVSMRTEVIAIRKMTYTLIKRITPTADGSTG